MTHPLDREQAYRLLDAHIQWLVENSDEFFDEVLDNYRAAVNLQMAVPPADSVHLGEIAVACITARSAMRKALTWITVPAFDNLADREQFLIACITELQEAILQATNALYWLERQGVVECIPPTSPAPGPEGGVS